MTRRSSSRDGCTRPSLHPRCARAVARPQQPPQNTYLSEFETIYGGLRNWTRRISAFCLACEISAKSDAGMFHFRIRNRLSSAYAIVSSIFAQCSQFVAGNAGCPCLQQQQQIGYWHVDLQTARRFSENAIISGKRVHFLKCVKALNFLRVELQIFPVYATIDRFY